MKLNYDNLDDAKTKLIGTFCLYKGKAIVVKGMSFDMDTKKYYVIGSHMAGGRGVEFKLDDPEFNCSDFNIGYVNAMRAAAWFYRVPMKQWKQGLRPDQMRQRASKREFSDIAFNSGRYTAQMLENTYPSLGECGELLRAQEANIMAFHKDFAMTFDHIHKDYILEYKGVNIGFTHDFKDMKLMDEHIHLMEALKEAAS